MYSCLWINVYSLSEHWNKIVTVQPMQQQWLLKCMKDMLSFNVHVSYKPIAKLCHLPANFKDNDESKNRQQVVFRINWSNRDSVGIQAFFVPSWWQDKITSFSNSSQSSKFTVFLILLMHMTIWTLLILVIYRRRYTCEPYSSLAQVRGY